MSKSYWMNISTDTVERKAAVLSWFRPICDGFEIESAQVLCDRETDREKKIKAIVRDERGIRKLATRTLGNRYSITLAPLREKPHA